MTKPVEKKRFDCADFLHLAVYYCLITTIFLLTFVFLIDVHDKYLHYYKYVHNLLRNIIYNTYIHTCVALGE